LRESEVKQLTNNKISTIARERHLSNVVRSEIQQRGENLIEVSEKSALYAMLQVLLEKHGVRSE
jgi:hypothetical protein